MKSFLILVVVLIAINSELVWSKKSKATKPPKPACTSIDAATVQTFFKRIPFQMSTSEDVCAPKSDDSSDSSSADSKQADNSTATDTDSDSDTSNSTAPVEMEMVPEAVCIYRTTINNLLSSINPTDYAKLSPNVTIISTGCSLKLDFCDAKTRAAIGVCSNYITPKLVTGFTQFLNANCAKFNSLKINKKPAQQAAISKAVTTCKSAKKTKRFHV